MTRTVKNALKRLTRSMGYDIVPYDPYGGSIATHLASLFGLLGINCVLDVGANVGWYGRFLRELGFAGYIVSFEPVARSYALLERERRQDANWSTHRLALGDRDGRATINVTLRSEFSSFLPTNAYGLEQYPGMSEIDRTEEVRVARLDTVFSEVTAHVENPRVFLKMDTQGWDLAVLRGATGCLASIEALQSEVYLRPTYDGSPEYLEAIATMTELGFELTEFLPFGRTERLAVIDADCVMVRQLSTSSDG